MMKGEKGYCEHWACILLYESYNCSVDTCLRAKGWDGARSPAGAPQCILLYVSNVSIVYRGFDGLQRRYLPGGEGLETELMMKQLGHQQEHHQDLNQFNSNHRNQEDEDQEPRYATQSLIRTEDSQCLLNISPQQQTIIRNKLIKKARPERDYPVTRYPV